MNWDQITTNQNPVARTELSEKFNISASSKLQTDSKGNLRIYLPKEKHDKFVKLKSQTNDTDFKKFKEHMQQQNR